jgi:hypothetical protein
MTSISTKWTPKKRDYVSEHKQLSKTTTVTTTHPLGVIVVCIEKTEHLPKSSFIKILDKQSSTNSSIISNNRSAFTKNNSI